MAPMYFTGKSLDLAIKGNYLFYLWALHNRILKIKLDKLTLIIVFVYKNPKIIPIQPSRPFSHQWFAEKYEDIILCK